MERTNYRILKFFVASLFVVGCFFLMGLLVGLAGLTLWGVKLFWVWMFGVLASHFILLFDIIFGLLSFALGITVGGVALCFGLSGIMIGFGSITAFNRV